MSDIAEQLAEYRLLLDRHADSQPWSAPDAEKLIQLGQQLGIEPNAVVRDAKMVKTARELERIVATWSNLNVDPRVEQIARGYAVGLVLRETDLLQAAESASRDLERDLHIARNGIADARGILEAIYLSSPHLAATAGSTERQPKQLC